MMSFGFSYGNLGLGVGCGEFFTQNAVGLEGENRSGVAQGSSMSPIFQSVVGCG